MGRRDCCSRDPLSHCPGSLPDMFADLVPLKQRAGSYSCSSFGLHWKAPSFHRVHLQKSGPSGLEPQCEGGEAASLPPQLLRVCFRLFSPSPLQPHSHPFYHGENDRKGLKQAPSSPASCLLLRKARVFENDSQESGLANVSQTSRCVRITGEPSSVKHRSLGPSTRASGSVVLRGDP